MAVITSPKGQSAHWYHKDGTPQHSVPLADGTGDRSTTLADARKLGLYPSVSGIIGILDKPGLMNWKLKQMVEFALKTPRASNLSESHYFSMVKDAAFQQVDDAADFGTRIHAEIEKFLRWDFQADPNYPTHPDLVRYVRPTIDWMLLKKVKILSPEIALVNHQHGFAGTSDAPYRAEKSFGILDYKSNKTKVGKPIIEYPEKLLQISAYFATHWGEAALDNPMAWGGNIYISSTQPGRTEAMMYGWERLKQGWEVFKMLCAIWRHFNEFDPRYPITSQPKWPDSKLIVISAPDINPTIGGHTALLAGVMDPPKIIVPSPELPSVPPLPTPQLNPSLPSQDTQADTDPATAILRTSSFEKECDGMPFLGPAACKAWKKESVITIYSWWYHPVDDKARVGLSADAALLEHGWKRCFKAYAANIDHENRMGGKSDPVIGLNSLPIKPLIPDGPTITRDDMKKMVINQEVAAPAKSPERIAQLERMKMGFGKHKKLTLVAVPTSYFIWCITQMENTSFNVPEHVKEYLSIPSVIKALDMESEGK